MSNKLQVSKNIELTQKLLDYLTTINYKQGYSFVVFSKKDKSLNEANQRLADNLQKQGNKVAKAVETGDKKEPWRLSYL